MANATIDIKKIIDDHPPGFSLQQKFYVEQEIYQREISSIFMEHWIFAGHRSQLTKPGDFFVVNFDTESVIITLNKDNKVNALLNVCRHRGSKLCLEEKGNNNNFACPYHAWCYDLNGELIAARNMPDDFNKAENGLHKVHLEQIGGLLFINMAEKPPSLAGFKKDLLPDLQQLGFETMKLAAHKSYDIPANWKLAVENYQECYHCAPSHQEFAQIHAMAMQPKRYADLKARYVSSENTVRTQASDFYFDLAKPGEEVYQYDRNPLLPNKWTGSRDGQPIAPLLGDLKQYTGGCSELMLGPVNFFLIYDDHMLGYRFLPKSLNECVCDVFWFVHQDAEVGQDYQLDQLTWLWDVTTQADKAIIYYNQQGVMSRFYQPGRLSTMEAFEQHFINWYLSKLKGACQSDQHQ